MDGRVVVVGVLVLSLAAACAGPEDEASSSSGVVRVGGYPPLAIDPALVVDSSEAAIARLLCEPLIAASVDGVAEPAAASSWQVSDGGATYTFELRDDLRFSDGSEVHAQSFVDGWNRFADPDLAAPNADLGAMVQGWLDVSGADPSGEVGDEAITGVRALDDLRLEVRLDAPDRYFALRVSQPQFCPVPPASLGSEPEQEAVLARPVANGPYRLTGPWREDESLSLVANEHHRDLGRGPEGIELVFFEDPATAYREYRAGNLDIAPLPAAELAAARDAGDAVHVVDAASLTVLGLPGTPPFDSPELRAALRSALDLEAVAERVLEGSAEPANGFVPPTASEHVETSCDACGFDPDAAASLWRSGAAPGQLTLTFPADSGQDDLAESIANDWRTHLGVETSLDPVRPEDLYEMIGAGTAEGPYLVAWSWEAPTAHAVLWPLFASASPYNLGYSNPEMDELLDAAAAAGDEQRAASYLRDADELVSSELPVLPITHDRELYVSRADLGSVELDHQGRLQLERLTGG